MPRNGDRACCMCWRTLPSLVFSNPCLLSLLSPTGVAYSRANCFPVIARFYARCIVWMIMAGPELRVGDLDRDGARLKQSIRKVAIRFLDSAVGDFEATL
jgi:hypothetical protein